MKLRTRLAQRGRIARSRPGTVNIPVARASTVTFETIAEMQEVQRRFDADEPIPTYGMVNMPLRVAFEEILGRWDDIRLAGEPERIRSNWANALTSLPIEFTPIPTENEESPTA